VHTRRDQVHAHTFMVGRLVSALLRCEPDLASPPLRRTTLGLIVGCILGVLAVGGFAVYGVIRPSQSTAWQKPGTLIVDKQTGTRYVLAGGRLHPVLNYASARLLLGRSTTVTLVPAATLAAVPRGTPVGIPGAPDVLPANTAGPTRWLVCASRVTSPAGAAVPAVTVRIGPDGGAETLPADRAVLVRDAGGTRYLAWRGSRLRLAAPWVGAALGYDTSAALPVRDGWLGVLPAGPDLGPPAVPHRGARGPVLDGRPTVVGQLFGVPDPTGGRDLYLLTAGGLRPVSDTEATLVLADPAGIAAYGGHPAAVRGLSPVALAGARVLPSSADAAALPTTPPALLADPVRSPCVRVLPGRDPAVSLATVPATGTSLAASVTGAAASGASAAASSVADRIDVAPGSGGLVRPGTDQARRDPAGPEPAAPATYLLTEDGALFPIADAGAAGDLGYDPDAAVGVPVNLLALLPAGPVLSQLRPGSGAGPP
jgi:type VII secretion protein EccB